MSHSEKPNNFYVYKYIRLDTRRVFYIGKGRLRRAENILAHNKYCKSIAKKHGFLIEYASKNLSETESFELERNLIQLFKSKGECEANFDPGGRGNSGRVSPMKGRKHSPETLKKISEGGKGRKVSYKTKLKLSQVFKGKERPESVGQKVSLALKGKTTWMKGKTHTEDSKVKMSESHIGKIPWNKGLKIKDPIA